MVIGLDGYDLASDGVGGEGDDGVAARLDGDVAWDGDDVGDMAGAFGRGRKRVGECTLGVVIVDAFRG